MLISSVPDRAKSSQKIKEESDWASYCSPASCVCLSWCKEQKYWIKSVSSENQLWCAYSSLFPCFILFHFGVEREGWHVSLWIMSSGTFRVVPLIEIFMFIQSVINMKQHKANHPALSMKPQNELLQICVFCLPLVHNGLLAHEILVILEVWLRAQEKGKIRYIPCCYFSVLLEETPWCQCMQGMLDKCLKRLSYCLGRILRENWKSCAFQCATSWFRRLQKLTE